MSRASTPEGLSQWRIGGQVAGLIAEAGAGVTAQRRAWNAAGGPKYGDGEPRVYRKQFQEPSPFWLWGEGWLDQGCVGDSDLAAH